MTFSSAACCHVFWFFVIGSLFVASEQFHVNSLTKLISKVEILEGRWKIDHMK